jgi:hypothetical protein
MSQFAPPCARAIFGAMGMAVGGLLLAGCAGTRDTPTAVTAGVMTPTGGSLKDDWAPSVSATPAVAARPTPKRERPTGNVASEPKTAMTRPDTGGELIGCGNSNACLSQLKALVDDPTHKWIGQTLAPVEYASGVRLFAYRALRATLSCYELTLGLAEIEAADATFSRPIPGVTPENAARVRLLNSQVDGELRAERSMRCKA